MDDGRDDIVLATIHRELMRHALQAELGHRVGQRIGRGVSAETLVPLKETEDPNGKRGSVDFCHCGRRGAALVC